MLGLIDTRDQPPPGGTREPWYIQVVASMFPWPAVITWLLVAGLVLDGWWAVGTLWSGVMLAAWRGLRLLPPDGGMRDYKQ